MIHILSLKEKNLHCVPRLTPAPSLKRYLASLFLSRLIAIYIMDEIPICKQDKDDICLN